MSSPSTQAASQVSSPLWRRVVASLLAVVAIIAILLSLVVGWAKTTLTDEDQFVATLADLPADDAVATTLSVRIADRIVERTGMTEFVVRVLPDQLEFLAASLTAAVTNTVADVTYEAITSDGFADVWEATLRVTHTGVSVLLSGTDTAILSDDGTVSIDVGAIANLAVERVERRGITLPDLDVEFGEIVLYESDQLASVQAAAAALNTAGWLVPLFALVMTAAAVWTAPDRRKMTAFLGLGTAVGSLVFLALLRTSKNSLLRRIDDDTAREAGVAVWDALIALLVQTAWALLVLSLIVATAAWMLGPSPRVKKAKTWTKAMISRWGEPEGTEASAVSRFFDEWLRAIETGIVIVAALVILFGPAPTVMSVVLISLVAMALIILAEVVAGPNHTPTDDHVEVDS